ncbi:MAG: hypothetical protein A3A80_02325 [Candidatus Terrybacteria bacterium RIFCSPLOWO2_01_FULL_44_24]|uniref:Uncharacterized protein n=1 Tax=Candidatus Terrybacteria bacterium RIFCSPHIGHO2_01_FULL_43_35 TaxID=1802361 RepID=A0A1G2PEE2_9BACT|nr:MAG: hypothetical protein A2828_02115 [Candidatus Terrybacteria bacterium RIFCSPHIGHO2_01_FULL_43_35]OHA50915.1 MAG: hypothetical protein A3A80_02325 [Candidatus Terrybacteria bacterium RIFCSPLOWO2_01_FULL_44_24]
METSTTSFQLLYHRLPKRVKDILLAPKTGDDIYAACQRHGVEERVYVYSGLVGMVLLGELHPNLLVRNIVETEHLNIEMAKALALEISSAVFQPVKSELISLYGITSSGASSVQKTSVEARTQQTKPAPVSPPLPPPSTRPAGVPLPPMPNASIDALYTKPSSPPTEQISGAPPPTKSFYSPQPDVPHVTLTPPAPPQIDNSGPQLEGNTVNLKDVGNKPSL